MCFTFIFKSHSAYVLRERPLFKSASLGERELIWLLFRSVSVFLLEWREFVLLIFIAALVPDIFTEESAQDFQRLLFVLLGDPQPALPIAVFDYLKINTLVLN